MYPRGNSEATKQTILDAAVKLFGKHGYYRTSISMVAKEAKTYRSSIAFHFGNKEDLLYAVFENYVEQWFQFLAKQIFIRVKEDNHGEVLQALIQLFIEEFHKNPDQRYAIHRIAMEAKDAIPKLAQRLRKYFLELQKTLEMFLWAGQQKGTITKAASAKSLANAFILMAMGFQVAIYIVPEMGKVDDYLQQLSDITNLAITRTESIRKREPLLLECEPEPETITKTL